MSHQMSRILLKVIFLGLLITQLFSIFSLLLSTACNISSLFCLTLGSLKKKSFFPLCIAHNVYVFKPYLLDGKESHAFMMHHNSVVRSQWLQSSATKFSFDRWFQNHWLWTFQHSNCQILSQVLWCKIETFLRCFLILAEYWLHKTNELDICGCCRYKTLLISSLFNNSFVISPLTSKF